MVSCEKHDKYDGGCKDCRRVYAEYKSKKLEVKTQGYVSNFDQNKLDDIHLQLCAKVMASTSKTATQVAMEAKELRKLLWDADLDVISEEIRDDIKVDCPKICYACGRDVSDKVRDFSVRKFGKVLCLDCQKK